MIPVHLRIAGFLSYRDPVELDFTRFDLACISGHNGAGKSSLLDAITWALFGQARRRDESLVNLQSKTAEVQFVFQYEQSLYRVLRTLPRNKTTMLEFQVLDSPWQPGAPVPENPTWRPLSERIVRDTQACIEDTLGLDYETFVNASFFLQGKADQFTRQNAASRKDVLGSILGLETWETYKTRAGERRRRLEEDLNVLDHRLQEIDAELAEADARKQKLTELETQLQRLAAARNAQQTAVDGMKRAAESLEQQRKLASTLQDALGRARLQLKSMSDRRADREAARAQSAALIGRAPAIEQAYNAWQASVKALQQWEKTAAAFHEHEHERAPLLQEIASEKARLQEEQRRLLEGRKDAELNESAVIKIEGEIGTARKLLVELEQKVEQRAALVEQSNAARETMAQLQSENATLKREMEELRERIDRLKSASGASCPLCGQELSPQHRASTLSQLETQGTDKAGLWRTNKSRVEECQASQKTIEADLRLLTSAEVDRLRCSTELAKLGERLKHLQGLNEDWKTKGAARLDELTGILDSEQYALPARRKLAKLDEKLAALGYDAAAHDRTRTLEAEQRVADEEFRRLEAARAALAPLESELANLEAEIAGREAEIAQQDAQFQKARESLALAEQQAPDLQKAEGDLFALIEQEQRLNQEVGAARQKVSVLDELRERKRQLKSDREALALNISHHKALERAFGKDGVPALLIEQALPEIEGRANELLERLSDGRMSVRFVTQTAYKEKKRADLRETLDIQISDGAGQRDYEMYSGGEAFRVDFAVRLALSEVLTRRKGARLQTLVIDEGFGSQDAEGRQRLIEAINLVKPDFAKILVITHLEELKDAFPNRIEVEKTPQGSTAKVV